jgi:GH25 family lysozyme M1 (1,4-beta-N-acetylmuramidase)
MAENWIDVSAHQGIINWPKVAASGVKGAVIRAGYGNSASQQDRQFAGNIKGATAAGLKAAVYWFSYADTVADARAEWAACQRVIEPYKSKILFVAYDYEYDSVRYYKKLHGAAPANDLINKMVNTFLNAAKADGYAGALYTNNDYRKNIFYAATMAAWNVWLADYSGGPDIKCFMQQNSSTGSVPGISGNVDMDILFQTVGANPPYSCDTSVPVTVARGNAYQALIICDSVPKVVAGTPDVVTVLHRYDDGNKRYFWFVPIGQPGQEAGIYINDGPRQFIIKIK